ncbi:MULTISPECIES: WxL domain-containing protein [unclassified Microbacterium]|uniref:WxL domain-containing protein n=1 Tax=unclassified Microbacterium TaxID=2609290 RepID=UPI00214CC65C|nr:MULTISPECIES: WxL domain-containing protein [unclassified Microbacterium]MCR2811020.1 WxL domain-containing protein [Microbacterium sp. zg.B185]WIM19584.1 WxL domain-containing protein [Microbacterium sp. zg-B185]
MKNSVRVVMAIAGAAVLVGGISAPAMGAAGVGEGAVLAGVLSEPVLEDPGHVGGDTGTAVRMIVAAGGLSITVPDSVQLAAGTPGGGAKGTVTGATVTDRRGGVDGWNVTYSIGPFTHTEDETIRLTKVQVIPRGGGRTGGTGTFVLASSSSGTSGPIASMTDVYGSNSATWNVDLNVWIPDTALAGEYTTTFVQSVTTAG